jgi:hypothetical protein
MRMTSVERDSHLQEEPTGSNFNNPSQKRRERP